MINFLWILRILRLKRNVGPFTISNARKKAITNEQQKSVQACDIKSVVYERDTETGQSIDWASVKIIGQENHACKIREWTVIRATTFPIHGTILQPHSLIFPVSLDEFGSIINYKPGYYAYSYTYFRRSLDQW